MTLLERRDQLVEAGGELVELDRTLPLRPHREVARGDLLRRVQQPPERRDEVLDGEPRQGRDQGTRQRERDEPEHAAAGEERGDDEDQQQDARRDDAS